MSLDSVNDDFLNYIIHMLEKANIRNNVCKDTMKIVVSGPNWQPYLDVNISFSINKENLPFKKMSNIDLECAIDGNALCINRKNFVNLAESPAVFIDLTPEQIKKIKDLKNGN